MGTTLLRSGITHIAVVQWSGAVTAATSVLPLLSAASSFANGAVLEGVIMCVWLLCGSCGAVGLVKRSRYGVILALAFYVQLVLWPSVFMSLRDIRQEQQRSFVTPVVILIVYSYSYFRKRWDRLR